MGRLNEELNKIAQITEPVKKNVEFMALLTELMRKAFLPKGLRYCGRDS